MTPNDTSSPEERDRLIAEALAHAEARDLSYRPPSVAPVVRWKGALASVCLLLGVVFLVAPPAWLRGGPPPTVPEEVRALGARMTLYVQAQAVDAYRRRNQRLPDRLEDLGATLPGVRFVRSNDRVYQLVVYGPDGRAVVYDSTRPSPELEALAGAFLNDVDMP